MCNVFVETLRMTSRGGIFLPVDKTENQLTTLEQKIVNSLVEILAGSDQMP